MLRSARSIPGSDEDSAAASSAMTVLNARHSTSACLRILRASARRPPPTRCAVSTLKPMAAA